MLALERESLSLSEQFALLGQISSRLSIESDRSDLVAVLSRLRTRRDLYAVVADGIDGLLKQYAVRKETASYLSTTALVRHYASAEEFYRAATERVAEAQDRIYSTYLRRLPPSGLRGEGAKHYFDTVLAWAHADQNHSVRRILGRRSQNDALSKWIGQQIVLAQALQNYAIRIIDWPLEADTINMVLVDSRHVFLLIDGDHPHKLRGMSVDSSIISQYLHEYYGGLWGCARAADEQT